MSYSKYEPNKAHLHDGIPFVYNKNNKRLGYWDARSGFDGAVSSMHTWAARAFNIAAANPDPELREYDLERLEWKLDSIETWLGAMRKALEETRTKQRKQETIDKLLALANDSAATPGEAENARRMAAQRQEKM